MSLFPFSTIERNDGEIPVPSATSASDTPRERRSWRSRAPRSPVLDARRRHGSTGRDCRCGAIDARHGPHGLDPRAQEQDLCLVATTRRCQRSSSIERSRQAVSDDEARCLCSPSVVARDDTRADPAHERVGVVADLEVDDQLLRVGIGAHEGRGAVEERRSRDRPALAPLPPSSRAPTHRGGRVGEVREGRVGRRRAERRDAVDEVAWWSRTVVGDASGAPDGRSALLPDPQLPQDVLLAVLVREDVVERGLQVAVGVEVDAARRRPRS